MKQREWNLQNWWQSLFPAHLLSQWTAFFQRDSCLKNPAIISNLLSQLISFFTVVASPIGTNVGLAFLMPPASSLVGSISSASLQHRVSSWCREMFKRDVELSNSPEFFRENSTLYFNFFSFSDSSSNCQ